MKAAVYEQFQGPISVQNVADPAPPDNGIVLQVKATGVCRSDWHGWMGHIGIIQLPHIPGHEIAGVVAEVGKNVRKFKIGDRVTLPFCCGCGICEQCLSGNQQVCDDQFVPGFTAKGSYAEYVAIDRAEDNVVHLPEEIDFVTAASLGCRFTTSFRAVVEQGKTSAGQWVAVHGCGGVGLSAIMIANAIGANVVAVDIADDKLEHAKAMGALATVNANNVSDVAEAIRELTNGGAHVSIDALGSSKTAFISAACLRRRGKHIQVGLMLAEDANAALPMELLVEWELEIIGSHGMQAFKFPAMFEMIKTSKLIPQRLVGQTLSLEEGCIELPNMGSFTGLGVKVIIPN
jgi:alcohol dehydrogenase